MPPELSTPPEAPLPRPKVVRQHQPGMLNRIEEILLATSLAIMTLLAATQVVLRYVFDTGLVWSLEATSLAFAWLIAIGMAMCVRDNGHIATDLLIKKLPAHWRRYADLLRQAICLAYAMLMLAGSSILVSRLFQLGHYARDIGVPKWLLTVVLPIGFALLGFRLVQLMVKTWRAPTPYGAQKEANE